MSNLYGGPSIDASYKVSYHLAKRFQRKNYFRNRTIRNKNCLWRPCLLTDQNGMSNSHRGSSIDASYQVSVYLDKLCQSRRFLEIDQSEEKNCCGGHVCQQIGTKWPIFIRGLSIDAFHQVSDHLAMRFQRRFLEIDQFLPNFSSYGWGVSEEKIEMWKVNGRQMTDAKWWQKLTLPLARWAKNGCSSWTCFYSNKVIQITCGILCMYHTYMHLELFNYVFE